MPLLDILNEYGFATMAAIAMGWFIWFIYTFITQEVTKKLGTFGLMSSFSTYFGHM